MQAIISVPNLNNPHYADAKIVTYPSGDNDKYLISFGRGKQGTKRMNTRGLQNRHVPDTRKFFKGFKNLNPEERINDEKATDR